MRFLSEMFEPLHYRNEELEARLQNQLGTTVRELRVMAGATSVVLQGRTETYRTCQLAHQLATDMTPLKVINDISVRCW
ncbi:MAG: hypothetical protein ACFCD0_22595 [Gemmataceae bacterium]